MSGGSHNYVYSTLANELGIPCGHYGYGTSDEDYVKDVTQTRRINPMEDEDLSEMMYDISCLLHSLEWYRSDDTGEEQYIKDKDCFKAKWLDRWIGRLEQMLERLRDDRPGND